jgi:hypothetical protein
MRRGAAYRDDSSSSTLEESEIARFNGYRALSPPGHTLIQRYAEVRVVDGVLHRLQQRGALA